MVLCISHVDKMAETVSAAEDWELKIVDLRYFLSVIFSTSK